MMTEPQVEDLQARPYVAIHTQTTLQALASVIAPLLGEVFAWLTKQGIAPAGPPFIRYLVIDMKAVLDIEVGVSSSSSPIQTRSRIKQHGKPGWRFGWRHEPRRGASAYNLLLRILTPPSNLLSMALGMR